MIQKIFRNQTFKKGMKTMKVSFSNTSSSSKHMAILIHFTVWF